MTKNWTIYDLLSNIRLNKKIEDIPSLQSDDYKEWTIFLKQLERSVKLQNIMKNTKN